MFAFYYFFFTIFHNLYYHENIRFCGATEAKRHIGINLSVGLSVHPSVCHSLLLLAPVLTPTPVLAPTKQCKCSYIGGHYFVDRSPVVCPFVCHALLLLVSYTFRATLVKILFIFYTPNFTITKISYCIVLLMLFHD